MKKALRVFLALFLYSSHLFAQELPVRWEELLASDWQEALDKSDRTCILPMGILEKHGLHSPLGTDLILVREIALRAAKQEYAVVFPEFFYGQIYEAKQQPGTFSLPSELVWDLLKATVEEIARNGFEKIVIVNGHGGNPSLIRYFIQSQLEEKKDYAVFFFDPAQDEALAEQVRKTRKSDPSYDSHGGENETSSMLYVRPELIKLERATNESGKDLKRLSLPNLYTGIWWYASFPNHYAGEGQMASKELGKLFVENRVDQLVKALQVVKSDAKTLELQNQFFKEVDQVEDK